MAEVDQIDRITRLMKYANPELPTYRRLQRLKKLVEQNVFLGRKDRDFLRHLQTLTEIPECQHWVAEKCRKHGTCKKMDESCRDYRPRKGEASGGVTDEIRRIGW